MNTCASCQFSQYTRQMNQPGLYCHKEPPKNQILPAPPPANMMMLALWPMVDETAWCGAWAPGLMPKERPAPPPPSKLAMRDRQ